MEVRSVEMFLRVLEQGSVTAAVRALGVTQPAVSGAIARLAAELGFDLFRRHGRMLVPTPEAQQFEQEARRALIGLAQLEEAACGISTARRGTLTIAANPGAAIAWLPGAVAGFRAARPEVTVRLLTRSSLEVRGMVAANAADIGVAQPPFDRGDTVLRRFRSAPVCVLPRKHALAAQSCITPSMLDGEAFISLTRDLTPRMAIAEAFEAARAVCHVAVECESFATAMGLVAAGAGWRPRSSPCSPSMSRAFWMKAFPYDPAYDASGLDCRRAGHRHPSLARLHRAVRLRRTPRRHAVRGGGTDVPAPGRQARHDE
jgi:DNA-binding transcriptional LysR family regulator